VIADRPTVGWAAGVRPAYVRRLAPVIASYAGTENEQLTVTASDHVTF
jgi:hypothetical protein